MRYRSPLLIKRILTDNKYNFISSINNECKNLRILVYHIHGNTSNGKYFYKKQILYFFVSFWQSHQLDDIKY